MCSRSGMNMVWSLWYFLKIDVGVNYFWIIVDLVVALEVNLRCHHYILFLTWFFDDFLGFDHMIMLVRNFACDVLEDELHYFNFIMNLWQLFEYG